MSGSDYIRDAIAKILIDDDVGPYMIGDLIILAEMTSSRGTIELFILSSDDMTVWKERGMLADRLDDLAARSVTYALEDREE